MNAIADGAGVSPMFGSIAYRDFRTPNIQDIEVVEARCRQDSNSCWGVWPATTATGAHARRFDLVHKPVDYVSYVVTEWCSSSFTSPAFILGTEEGGFAPTVWGYTKGITAPLSDTEVDENPFYAFSGARGYAPQLSFVDQFQSEFRYSAGLLSRAMVYPTQYVQTDLFVDSPWNDYNRYKDGFKAQVQVAEQKKREAIESWRELSVLASETEFEDGFENKFASCIRRKLSHQGLEILNAFDLLAKCNLLPLSTQIEALKVLGRIEDKNTRLSRAKLLTQNLRADEAAIRDAATVALSYLEDRSTIYAIARAALDETDDDVRRNMIAVARDISELAMENAATASKSFY